MFSCAPFIKEIGRGKAGARHLSTEQACELFSAMLKGEVSELELGAVLLSFRVKGESEGELVGFCQAVARTQTLLTQPTTSALPCVVIPSYNGARRRPNYTPLMAGLLAKRGHPVLVHGLHQDPTGRITSHEVFAELGWPIVQSGQDINAALAQAAVKQVPLFVGIHELHPGLAALIDKRAILGVRNSSHTIVKFLQPFDGNALMLASYTHPEFWHLQRAVLSALGRVALVMRGHEGEPVAHPQKAPRMDAVVGHENFELDAGDPTFTDAPDPNPQKDAASTAQMTRELLALDTSQLPSGFVRQLQAIAKLQQHAQAV